MTLYKNKAFRGVAILFATLSFINGFAYSLNTLSDTQSSVKINAYADHTIFFVTPSGVNPGDTITLDFPGYDMGITSINNIDFATSSSAACTLFEEETLGGVPSGDTWGFSTSSERITFTAGASSVPPNRCIQIKIGSHASHQAVGVTQIINPSTPGNYAVAIGGSFGDVGTITTAIIDDDTIALTGMVPQSLTFTVSTSTIYFGLLSDSITKYASSTNTSGDTTETIAHTLTVSTNAASGFALTARGDTLTSLQRAQDTISSIGAVAAPSSLGTEQFGLRVTETGGVGVTIDPTYSHVTSYGYDGSGGSASLLATGNGSTPDSVFSVRYLANIAPNTEAGTYAANLIYVVTANF